MGTGPREPLLPQSLEGARRDRRVRERQWVLDHDMDSAAQLKALLQRSRADSARKDSSLWVLIGEAQQLQRSRADAARKDGLAASV